MLVCAFLCICIWHARPRVQRAPGLPCALLFWAPMNCKPRAKCCRENAEVCRFAAPSLGGEGRRAARVARCLTGWGEVQGTVSSPPHPAASGRRCASPGRVDPPPPGEGAANRHTSAFSRQHFARGLQFIGALKTRGRREDRVRAAPAVSRANAYAKKNAHEHTGSAEAFRPSLRNGFTTYIVLSPVRPGLLVTVTPEKRELPRNLTPAIGASGPHDFAVRSNAVRQ